MPTKLNNGFPQPLKAQCFQCKKTFALKYNPAIGMPSQKNYWLYWTDENWNYKERRRQLEKERGKRICDNCLRNCYLNKKWEFLDQVKSASKRQTLASYVYHGII